MEYVKEAIHLVLKKSFNQQLNSDAQYEAEKRQIHKAKRVIQPEWNKHQ
ncbi:hypothetical protein QLZ26_11055 [Cronobacter universalis]|nr:hypothetical protein [Cronobacter universalis]MDI7660640.1 hypothetical protein [Cronobacter universalis]